MITTSPLNGNTHLLQRVWSVFRYGIQSGRANNNPATELQGVIKTQKVRHRLALENSELPLFIQTVKNYVGLPSTRYAILLMVLIFVRTDELGNTTWDEFDLEKAIWKLSADRTKKETVHLVL